MMNKAGKAVGSLFLILLATFDWWFCARCPRHDPAPTRSTRMGAVIRQHGNCKAERLDRDENLRTIRKLGRQKWKQESGYTRRNLAETCIFRLKTIFGERLSARSLLNRMTNLGVPNS